MPEYRVLLSSDPRRLEIVEQFVKRLREPGPKHPARFIEAARNFVEEEHLGIDFWHALVDFVEHEGAAASLEQAEAQLTEMFRHYQSRGPKLTVLRSRFGRIAKHTDFISLLMRDDPGIPRTAAQQMVHRLMRCELPEARVLLNAIKLARFLMWSTYCETKDNLDPFDPRMPDAKLVDSLGLKFEAGDQFLMFVYELPTGTICCTPTIADAYSKNFFFPFRVGGRTHPIRYQDELAGRPEVVHDPFTGSFLRKEIQVLEPDE